MRNSKWEQNEKMRQSRKFLMGFIVAVAIVQLTGCTQVEAWKNLFFFGDSEMESEMSENQRKAKIQVVSITGNELTYIEKTESAIDTEKDTEKDTESELSTELSRDADESQRAEMGEWKNMSRISETGEMPGEGKKPDMAAKMEKGIFEQTVTVYLPVGVKVYTETGKQMSFSILEAGDQLEALFEMNASGSEVITEIQMLGE